MNAYAALETTRTPDTYKPEADERYVLTLIKEPPEERRVFRGLSDKASYFEVKTGEVGDRVSYTVNLSPQEFSSVASRVYDDDFNLIHIQEVGPKKQLAFSDHRVPGQKILSYIGISERERKAYRGQGVKVGVADTGIAASTASRLGSRLVATRGFNGNSAVVNTTGEMHGTQMVGLAVPEGASLSMAAFLDPAGSGTLVDGAAAINWLVDVAKVDVISCSFGETDDYEVLRQAVANASSKGVKVFASAGNNGSYVTNYPASYPGAYKISNYSADTNSIAPSSTRGGIWAACCGTPMTFYSGSNNPYLFGDGGTSAACALSVDIFARLLSRRELTPNNVINRMAGSARSTGASRDFEGNGVLNFSHPNDTGATPPDGADGQGDDSYVPPPFPGLSDGGDPGSSGLIADEDFGFYEVYVSGCVSIPQPPKANPVMPPLKPVTGGCKSSLEGPSGCNWNIPQPNFGGGGIPFPGDLPFDDGIGELPFDGIGDFPISDVDFGDFPEIDCNMPDFGNTGFCDPIPGTGGSLPGGSDPSGNPPPTDVAIPIKTDGPTTKPREKYTFEQKTCYPNGSSAMGVISLLLIEAGINPLKIIFEIGTEWDKTFSRCFDKGSRKWDAAVWLAEFIGCIIIDEGDGKVYIGPPFIRPGQRTHVFDERTNLFVVARTMSDSEDYYAVEVFRTGSGGFNVISFTNSPFNPEPSQVLRIQVGPNYTITEARVLAAMRAGQIRQQATSVQVSVPFSENYYMRDRMILRQPSRSIQESFIIVAKQSTIADTGHISVLTGMLPATLETLDNMPNVLDSDLTFTAMTFVSDPSFHQTTLVGS